MHPALMAAVSADQHADLLRRVERRRQAAAVSSRRPRPGVSEAVDGLARAASRLRRRAATAGRPTVASCCA